MPSWTGSTWRTSGPARTIKAAYADAMARRSLWQRVHGKVVPDTLDVIELRAIIEHALGGMDIFDFVRNTVRAQVSSEDAAALVDRRGVLLAEIEIALEEEARLRRVYLDDDRSARGELDAALGGREPDGKSPLAQPHPRS